MRGKVSPLREDILVSVCFSDLPEDRVTFTAVCALAKHLDERFRFHEIVVVVDAAVQERYFPLVEAVPNLRLLAAQPGCGYYAKRLLVAEEAIGDVVLLTRADEFGYVDVVAMIEDAADGNQAILGIRPAAALIRKGVWAPLILLGRLTRLNVGPRDLQTIALPRTMLNQLLSHDSPELALRFPPRDPRFPLIFREARAGIEQSRGDGIMAQRVQMVYRLLVHLAPGILSVVAMTSALLALLGLCFVIYVLGVWFLVEDIAPGWLTTSMMLSLTAIFLGVSILGLSLGMQQIIGRQERAGLGDLVHEVNRVDLFGKVAADLNIDRAAALAGPENEGDVDVKRAAVKAAEDMLHAEPHE